MPAEFIDKPKAVREGEGLDWGKVEAYLKSALPDLSGELQVQQFPSGFSNLTYLLSVGETELILRRPPFGTKAKTAHDMGREVRMLQALKPVFPYCPAPLAYCEDLAVMDAPFYVMERLRGVILRANPPKGMTLTPEQARALCENAIDAWAQLHCVDYRAVGLGDFGKPEGYVRRQVEGWSERYRRARTDDAPDFEAVMQWLAAHQPPDSPHAAVIHNDFKFDNLVLDPNDPTRIIGVLDWEMATIGDPLMDLGSGLAYWVNATDPDAVQMIRQLPTHLPGMLTREEVLARYAEKMGRPIARFDFYYCFGLFRLAVIAQQIYYRFYHGQTKDPRFQMLVFAVRVLEETAAGVIARATN
jgi:aminoglycoside phosphotransferase (APT) family kinase protein